MPRVSTRKSSDCFLVWDLSYEAKRTSHKRGGQRSTRKPSVQLRWQQGKIPFYFKWLNYSEAAQTKRRSSQSMVGKWTDFGSQNQPFYRLIFSLIILDWSCDQSRDIVTNVNVEFPQSVVIWLVLPNKAFLWFFFHAHYTHHWFSSLYFSMTSLFWVFLSSVCFFSLSFVLCFSKSNFIWFSLHTACFLISEYFIWSFCRFVQTWYFACHVFFRARLVTVFSLPLTRLTFVVSA